LDTEERCSVDDARLGDWSIDSNGALYMAKLERFL
jgi:hypothetical protein